MFVKLTERVTIPGTDPKPILVNMRHIISVAPNSDGCTLYVASGSPRIDVIESFDDVMQSLEIS